MKNATNKLWLAVGFIGLMGLATQSHAAYNRTQNIDIKVSINDTRSVAISTNNIQFGALPVSSSAISGSSVTVTNDSNGLIETYTILGATATAATNDVWDLAAAVGANTFSMSAIFNTNTKPLLTDFHSEDYLDKSNAVVADGTTKLTNGVENGYQVNPSLTRGLWFRMDTPSSVKDFSEHKATITLAVQ